MEKSPKQTSPSYYDRTWAKHKLENKKQPDLYIIALLIVVFIFGMVAGASLQKKDPCTVTITDMRGVQHQITGKADE